MSERLLVPVGDLLGPASRERRFSGALPVELDVGETRISGEMAVEGVVRGGLDSIELRLQVSAPAHFSCVRCLTEWDSTVAAEIRRHLGVIEDEDGYAIVDGVVDVAPPAVDELALSIPPAPVCRPDCRGLCPTCGNDLNNDPCDGHGDDTDSPFTVLKDLFDS